MSGTFHWRGGPRGAYAILKYWYQHASVQAPNPSGEEMEKVRGDFWTLY